MIAIIAFWNEMIMKIDSVRRKLFVQVITDRKSASVCW